MDEIGRAEIRSAGYDPDDPIVIAAIERVRAELAALGAAIRAAGEVTGDQKPSLPPKPLSVGGSTLNARLNRAMTPAPNVTRQLQRWVPTPPATLMPQSPVSGK